MTSELKEKDRETSQLKRDLEHTTSHVSSLEQSLQTTREVCNLIYPLSE
jgi:predicted RNase H-like nuclease (RuvC/YqgF family)